MLTIKYTFVNTVRSGRMERDERRVVFGVGAAVHIMGVKGLPNG